MSYSTLFNDGLHQLWDRKYRAGTSPSERITISVFSTAPDFDHPAKPSRSVLQSFLSFDEPSLGSIYEASSSIDSLISCGLNAPKSSKDPKREFTSYPASVSRRSFESAVTLPQTSRKSRSSTSSVFGGTLSRRRSLPEAKPAPCSIPPPTPTPSRRASGASWLPRIAVSRFHPSIPYCSKSSDSDHADGEECDVQHLSDASSSSSSSSKRTKSSANSISQVSTKSASSTSTITVYSPSLRIAVPLPHPSTTFSNPLHSIVPVSVSDESDLELPHVSLIPLPPSPRGDSLSISSISRSSTVSTRYRKARRSDALAQLEGHKSPIPPVPPLPSVHSRSHSNPQLPSFAPRPSSERRSSLHNDASFVSFTEDEDSSSGLEMFFRRKEPRASKMTASTNIGNTVVKEQFYRPTKLLRGWRQQRRRNFIDLR
ncbi:uncharacterized protein EI90DRAFT_3130027 [Cantharellus anzutake]|uniref:uncharacterized protein n=1 Tax=Cantharellus anzutake TaxID=1750568 RepID=UPI001904C525|nr:uncharacterized protein EI90DRAFT_3130027 [Cantharellus anzutake]KAF8324330.1 hypothetical protein EI90DRAFT_3130027 [Cantharellus anzutake]